MSPAQRRWHLTPWGWILLIALGVLIVLAVAVGGEGVDLGLIAVIVVWAGLLASNFPSSRLRGRSPRGVDLGAEMEREREDYPPPPRFP